MVVGVVVAVVIAIVVFAIDVVAAVGLLLRWLLVVGLWLLVCLVCCC